MDAPDLAEFVLRLQRVRVLPVIRVPAAAEAMEVAARLVDAGIDVIEVTATIDGWPAAVRALRERFAAVLVGAGTVTTSGQAAAAVASGAQFLVSPYSAPGVRIAADGAGLPFVEGGFTPGEIARSAAGGVAKYFPAHVGGPSALRSMLAVLPGTHIVPTGGIRLVDVPDWLAAGALAVGVGRALTAPGDIAGRLATAFAG